MDARTRIEHFCFRLGVLIVSCLIQIWSTRHHHHQDSKRYMSPLPKPLAVVKWYRIKAYWYKPDPPGLGAW